MCNFLKVSYFSKYHIFQSESVKLYVYSINKINSSKHTLREAMIRSEVMGFTGVTILTNRGKVGIIGNSCKKGSWEMNAILLYKVSKYECRSFLVLSCA